MAFQSYLISLLIPSLMIILVPKIVVAPTDAEDAFYLTMEAFNLAEEYQCPVIILSDLQLSLGKQTVKNLDYNC
jgi:2-oxoglutarate ferredoxin oxidoreductase subunit alpha